MAIVTLVQAGRAITTVSTRQPLNWHDMMFDLTPTRSHVVWRSLPRLLLRSDRGRSIRTAMDRGMKGR